MKILPPNKIQHHPNCRCINEQLLKGDERIIISVARNNGKKWLFETLKEILNDRLHKNQPNGREETK